MTDAEFRRLLGPPPRWHGGASSVEVIVFELTPHYPGDGSAIACLDDDLLEAHLREAQVRLRAANASAWIKRYARQLAVEARKRTPQAVVA